MQNEWQPIEKAPSDKPVLIIGGLLYTDLARDPKPVVSATKAFLEPEGYWSEDEDKYIPRWRVCDTCYYAVWVQDPTHFMELPEPSEVL